MICADVDRLMSEGVPVAELRRRAEVAKHVQSCPHCEELLSWAANPVPAPEAGPLFEERIRSLLKADLKPVSPLPSAWTAAGGAFLLAGVVLLMHALAMGAGGWTALSRWQALWLSGLFMAVLLLAAVSLMASIRPGSRERVSPAIPVVALAVGFPALTGWLFPYCPRDHFVAQGIHCLAGGIMVAALTAAIAYAVARRGYSSNWSRTGALVGVLSSSVALGALQLSCAKLDLEHLLVWHGLVMVAAIAAGYLTGRRIGRA